MRKVYFYLNLFVALLFAAVNMNAQTTAYIAVNSTGGISWKPGYGYNGCVFSFDISDPSTVKEVVFKLEPIEFPQYGFSEAVLTLAGTDAGDVYYAMAESEYGSELKFCTYNFETGEKTVIGNGYRYIKDMAYDAAGKKLYGIEPKTSSSKLHEVDVKTGAVTEVKNFEDIRFVAIASDGNGTMYGLATRTADNISTAVLYTIETGTFAVTEKAVLGEVFRGSCCSMAYNEGTLYLSSGNHFYTIDPVAGTMTESEKMLPLAGVTGLTFSFSTKSSDDGGEDPETPVNDNLRVRVVETFGDVMGDTPINVVSKREVTYYDKDNNPVRGAVYGRIYGTEDFQINRYNIYEYNEEGQLALTYSQQYGQYDGEDFAFKTSKDSVTYEYDAEGRLVKQFNVSTKRYTSYEYDAEGNLVFEADNVPDYYDDYEGDYYVMKSFAYSDFVAPGCPQTIVGDGRYDSYKTLAKLAYDDKNRLVSKKTYDATGEVLRQAEYWTYEGNMLVMYEDKKVVKENEEYVETDNKRIVYSLDNNDPNRVKEENLSFYNGSWSGVPYCKVTEKGEYNGTYAVELTVEKVADAINTVKLSFPAPLIAVPGSVAFDVYRHGIKVARLTSENLNTATGMFEYMDRDVVNGVYDYFVQTVMIDETMKETGYNVSNVVKEEIMIDLPAASNVHYVSHRIQDDQYWVTIAWDAPEGMTEELGFKRYNVFLKGMKAADNREEDGQATSYEMAFGYVDFPNSKVKEITIETVYKYGKVKTAPVVIDLDNPFPAVNENLKVRVVETFGDAMGDTPINEVSKREVTYYNKANNPVRGAVYGRIYGSDTFQINRYQVYEYNEEGQLSLTYSQQYGQYDGEDFAFKASKDSVTYEYDAEGRLVKELTVATDRYKSYEYDAEGNLVFEADNVPDYYDDYEGDYYVMQSFAYSDFVAPGCPQTIVGDGRYDSYKTLARLSYDSQNRLVSKKTYDATGEVLRQAEYWTYEGAMLVMYENKKVQEQDGEYVETDNKRTLYSLDNNDPNRVKEVSQSISNGEWTDVPYCKVTESAEYNEIYATDMEVEHVADAINTVKISFPVPNLAVPGTVAFDVYRHGIAVARLTAENINAETGRFEYIDSEVKNGVYDYFVQTVMIDETGKESGLNVSDVVTEQLYVELPAATNIHYVSHRIADQQYYVTIAWEEPEGMTEELGFQRYNVFLKGMKVADNKESDGQDTSYEMVFGNVNNPASKVKEIFVETVYKFGKAQTEPVEIDLGKSVEDVAAEALLTVKGEEIIVNKDNVTVEIISAAGVVVDRYFNVRSVNLSVLNGGVYVVKASCGNEICVIKQMVK